MDFAILILCMSMILLFCCIGCQLARVKLWRDAYWDLRHATDGLVEQLARENETHAHFEKDCG